MRILMVNKFLYPKGGAETYVIKLGKWLENHGNEVEYFGMQDDKNIIGNKEGLYTENLDFHDKSRNILTYPAKIIYSKENREKIRKIIKSFHPDIVHLNNINFHITPSVIDACVEENVPVVWTLHDFQTICPNHLLYNGEICEKCTSGSYMNCIKGKCIHNSVLRSAIGCREAGLYRERGTYSKVSAFICPSKFMKKKMEESAYFNGDFIFLQNFAEIKKPKGLKKENYVLFFGRLSEEKGIKDLIKLSDMLPNIHFAAAGTGPMESDLIKAPNIDFVGFKTGEELHDLIEKAEMSVYQSKWYENCPMSIIESISLGTPVLTYDRGGMGELVTDGVNGYACTGLEDMKNRILSLSNDHNKLLQMEEGCQNSRFTDLDDYGEQLIKIYKRASKQENE